jgi:hypothetical protein
MGVATPAKKSVPGFMLVSGDAQVPKCWMA